MKLFAAPVVTAAGPRQGRGVALFRPADTRLDANLSAPGLPVTVVEGLGSRRIARP